MHVAAKDAFAAADAVCAAQCPGCGCASQQTKAEDGYSTHDPKAFDAHCLDGQCRSAVKDFEPVCNDLGLQAPKAPKACSATSECTYLLQTYDCCGSQRAVGVAKYAKRAMEKAEFACTQQMAVCDCAPKPVVAEDGASAGAGLIAVQCEAGLCSTWIK